eukprot:749532-Hanusia_phi.AAC.1
MHFLLLLHQWPPGFATQGDKHYPAAYNPCPQVRREELGRREGGAGREGGRSREGGAGREGGSSREGRREEQGGRSGVIQEWADGAAGWLCQLRSFHPRILQVQFVPLLHARTAPGSR